jgi:osmotically-inducible protein OsmY
MTPKLKAPQVALFALLLLTFTFSAWAAPRVKGKPAKNPKATQVRCSATTDADIVKAVQERLQTDPDIAKQMNHFNVSSKRKVVKLEGWLAGNGVIARAVNLARTTKCVKRVVGARNIKKRGGGNCGPGLKPCGDGCIDKNSVCNIRSGN